MSRPKSNASRSSKIIKMIDLELIVEGCDVAWRDFVKRTGCRHDVDGRIIIVVDVLLLLLLSINLLEGTILAIVSLKFLLFGMVIIIQVRLHLVLQERRKRLWLCL